MMYTALRRSLCVCMLLLLCSGCASSHTTNRTHIVSGLRAPVTDQRVALTVMSPARAPQANTRTATFHLGAGDALGQAIFANYAAVARANAGWQYASGEKSD